MIVIQVVVNVVAGLLLYRGIRFALEKSDQENRLRLTEEGHHDAAMRIYGGDKRKAHIAISLIAAVLLVLAVNVAGQAL